VIPRLLNGENLVMAASTGSGKTLAFTLPVIQTLISQEQQVSNDLKLVKD
jgi:ATP-dependent RNA helicase RhlE